jgi:heme-binding NEAT domain protein
MKFRFPLVLMLAALIFSLFAVPVGAQYADGTYEVPYEMKEASSDNTSIADGYFQSPATLTVENGVNTITLTVTGKEYIQSLSTPSGSVSVVSEGDDTRTVQFQVGDLSQPLSMDMHIIVPDLYDQTHTARAVFDTSGLPAAGEGGAAVEEESAETAAAAGGEQVENPKTGENSPIALYASLMVVSAIALFAIWKFRPASNK